MTCSPTSVPATSRHLRCRAGTRATPPTNPFTGATRDAASRVAKHRRGLPPGSFLDIGCAYGYALDEARAQGWSVVGVEPSPAAAQRARELDLRVVPDTGAALAEHPEGFDVVAMCQVLSHVPDPVAAVASAARALKPGGLLFIETWRRDTVLARLAGRHWHVISPPTVVWLETSSSIRALLERVGLDVVGWTRGRKTVSLGLVASLLDDRRLPRPVAAATHRLTLRDGAFPRLSPRSPNWGQGAGYWKGSEL